MVSDLFSLMLIPIVFVVSTLLSSLFLLGGIAFATVFERKTIAIMQNRRGPNRAGWFGLLQAIGDAVKLMTKAQISKKQTSILFFYFAPFSALFISWFMAYFVMFASLDDFSLYFLFIWTSLNVYSLPLAGVVTSHSKFAFLGGMRSFSQLLSYELSLSVLFLIIIIYTGTPILFGVLEFQRSHLSLCYSMFPVFIIWFIVILAETNRVPFDLPEAEAELVAGFATEYSSFSFAAFFLAEYGCMLIYSYITALVFFYPYSPTLFTVFFFFLFVWTRTTLPRYKVDQLLWIGWYCFLPITLLLYVVYYYRLSLFNIFGSTSFFFVSFLNKSDVSFSNKYVVLNGRSFAYLQKREKYPFYKSLRLFTPLAFLKDGDRLFASVGSMKQNKALSSRFWMFIPFFSSLFSYFQLLSAAHGVFFSYLSNVLRFWVLLVILLLVRCFCFFVLLY